MDAKSVEYFYDELGRLSKVQDWADRETIYTYDNMNRLTEILRPNGSKRKLAYDANRGSLIKIEERTSRGIPIMIHQFTYDDDSRLIKNFRVPIDLKIDRESWNATYNADNQFSSWNWTGTAPNMSVVPTYDADGNMTSGPVSERTASTYIYDVRNRLLSCNGVLYTYDAEDNRSSLRFTEDGAVIEYSYVYNRISSVSEVLIRNKSIIIDQASSTSSTYYIYGAGLEYEVSFDENGNEICKYYHSDQVGSTIALTDDEGNIIDKFSYDTWGYVKHTEGDTDTPFLYVGAFGVQTDHNGLINMRARYYNPTTQTFINPDPIGFAGGMNWYAYANGNPLSNIAATGFCAITNPSTYSNVKYDGYGGAYDDPFSFGATMPDFGGDFTIEHAKTALTVLGALPIIGTPALMLKAGINIYQGNYEAAMFDLACAVPLAGTTAVAGRLAINAGKKALSSSVSSASSAVVKTAVSSSANSIAKSAALGRIGEKAVGITSPKVGYNMPSGKMRFPDNINRDTKVLTEVKNVANLSYTRQLRDYVGFSQAENLAFDLYIRPTTKMSAPLKAVIDSKQITVKYIP